jgi:mRNA interferase MazF
MGGFVKGDVVVVLFPFSDLSSAKKRPALVLAAPDGDDVILCQITSRLVSDRYAVLITENDFSSESLQQESNVRPTRIFFGSFMPKPQKNIRKGDKTGCIPRNTGNRRTRALCQARL